MPKRKDKARSTSSRGSTGSKSSRAKYSYSELFPVNIATPISNAPPKDSCCACLTQYKHSKTLNQADPIQRRIKHHHVITIGKFCVGGLLLTALINLYFGSFQSSKDQITASGSISSSSKNIYDPTTINQNGTPLTRKELDISELMRDKFGMIVPLSDISHDIEAYSIGLIEYSSSLETICSKNYSQDLSSFTMNEIEKELIRMAPLWSQGFISFHRPMTPYDKLESNNENIIQTECDNRKMIAFQNVKDELQRIFDSDLIAAWMMSNIHLLDDLSQSFQTNKFIFEDFFSQKNSNSKLKIIYLEMIQKLLTCALLDESVEQSRRLAKQPKINDLLSYSHIRSNDRALPGSAESSYVNFANEICSEIRDEMIVLFTNLSENDRSSLYIPINSVSSCSLAETYANSLSLEVTLGTLTTQSDLCVVLGIQPSTIIIETQGAIQAEESPWLDENNKSEEEDPFLRPYWYHGAPPPPLVGGGDDSTKTLGSTSTSNLRGKILSNEINSFKKGLAFVIRFEEGEEEGILDPLRLWSKQEKAPSSSSSSTSSSTSSSCPPLNVVLMCIGTPTNQKMKLLLESLKSIFDETCFVNTNEPLELTDWVKQPLKSHELEGMESITASNSRGSRRMESHQSVEFGSIYILAMGVSSQLSTFDRNAAAWWGLFPSLSNHFEAFTFIDSQQVKQLTTQQWSLFSSMNLLSLKDDEGGGDSCSQWWVKTDSSLACLSLQDSEEARGALGLVFSLGCPDFNQYIKLVRSFYPPRWRNGGSCVEVSGCESKDSQFTSDLFQSYLHDQIEISGKNSLLEQFSGFFQIDEYVVC